MPVTITKNSICDRALQVLGYSSVSSVPQAGSRGAKSMERAYNGVKLSELQKHFWHFAIKRALVPASATPPVHTKRAAYPLPNDYLMLAPEDQDGDFPVKNDWILEAGHIISDETGPLAIRYISLDVSETLFDPIFAEALALALALTCCEELTSSNTKTSNIAALYDQQISIARKRGSILVQKQRAPISPWISMRG